MMPTRRFLVSIALAAILSAPQPVFCEEAYMPESYVKLRHPEWSRDAVIYQINTRQFTPEGTFAAAQRHPEWYQRDCKGDFHSPAWPDWSDVIQPDYSQTGLRRYMIEAMKW